MKNLLFDLAVCNIIAILLCFPIHTASYNREFRILRVDHVHNHAYSNDRSESINIKIDNFDVILDDIEETVKASLAGFSPISNSDNDDGNVAKIVNSIVKSVTARLWEAVKQFSTIALEEDSSLEGSSSDDEGKRRKYGSEDDDDSYEDEAGKRRHIYLYPDWLKFADNSALAKYDSNRVNKAQLNKVLSTEPRSLFDANDPDSSRKYAHFFEVAVAYVEVMFNMEKYNTVEYFLNHLVANSEYINYLDLETNKFVLTRLLNVWFELSRAQGKFYKSLSLGMLMILKSDDDKVAQLSYKLRLLFLSPPSLLYDKDAAIMKSEIFEDLVKLNERNTALLRSNNASLDDFLVLFPSSLTFNFAHQETSDRLLLVELTSMMTKMAPDLHGFVCDRLLDGRGNRSTGSNNRDSSSISSSSSSSSSSSRSRSSVISKIGLIALKNRIVKGSTFSHTDVPAITASKPKKDRKRLSVAFISSYFYDHSVGRILLESLSILKKVSEIERGESYSIPFDLDMKVFYIDGTMSQQEFKHLKSLQMFDHSFSKIHKTKPKDYILTQYQNLLGSSFIHLPDDIHLIRSELCRSNLDFLVFADIGLRMSTYALATSRLAYYQAAFWGHPVTAGIPDVIDFFWSLDTETDDASGNYEEQLVRMNEMNTIPMSKYNPSDVLSRFDLLSKLGMPFHSRYLAVLGRLHKIHPAFEDIIISILITLYTGESGEEALLQNSSSGDYVDDYYILFVSEYVQERNEQLLFRLREKFVNNNIPIAILNKIRFAEYSSFYPSVVSHASAVLDTFPYGGCLSTYDAISNFVPVVTFPSSLSGGRFTLSIYLQMDYLDLVARNEVDFVELSIKLLQSKDFRRKQSRLLEEKFSNHVKENRNFKVVDEWITFIDKLF